MSKDEQDSSLGKLSGEYAACKRRRAAISAELSRAQHHYQDVAASIRALIDRPTSTDDESHHHSDPAEIASYDKIKQLRHDYRATKKELVALANQMQTAGIDVPTVS